MDAFENSLQHLLAELERIDLLIAAQVARARQLYTNDEQFRGLYISEEEVNALLKQPVGFPRWARGQIALGDLAANLENISRQINDRKQLSVQRGIELRLHSLQHLFGLSSFEIDALLVCFAVEADLRYERLYAYLQDDVTKKRPSVDLVLNLLCTSMADRVRERQALQPGAPLIDHRLVVTFDEPAQPPATLLSKSLHIDPRIAGYVLGSDQPDSQILPFVRFIYQATGLEEMVLSSEMKSRLLSLAENSRKDPVLFYFQGIYGSGRKAAAAALCRQLNMGLMVVDLENLHSTQYLTFSTAVKLICREALLRGHAVYWEGFDILLAEDKSLLRKTLLAELVRMGNMVFLSGEKGWEPTSELGTTPVGVEFARPTYTERVTLWHRTEGQGEHDADIDFAALA